MLKFIYFIDQDHRVSEGVALNKKITRHSPFKYRNAYNSRRRRHDHLIMALFLSDHLSLGNVSLMDSFVLLENFSIMMKMVIESKLQIDFVIEIRAKKIISAQLQIFPLIEKDFTSTL